MPLVLVTIAIGEMQSGEVLKVTGDDPLFEQGMRDFCNARDLGLVALRRDESSTTIWIEL